MKLDLAHLERGCMAMPHQVVDETAVFADLLSATAVRDPRRLHDSRVVAHVIDDAHEAVVEHRQRLVEDFLQRRYGSAPGLAALATLDLDFSVLLPTERHGCLTLSSCPRKRASRGKRRKIC